MFKKVLYVNENNKLLYENRNINEGGLARNLAIMRWLRENICDMQEIILSNNRYYNIIKVLKLLIISRKKTIIFQYITVGVPLFNTSLVGRWLSKIFILLVKNASLKNEIIFDISDLKYEQCQALSINFDKMKTYKYFEEKFFSLGVKYIFASQSMRKYAAEKYCIPFENTDVIINGGIKSNTLKANCVPAYNNKIKYVYCGTLNKGRNIEEMINIFLKNKEVQLYLLGSSGEWINNEIVGENVSYLGSFPEEKAHSIVASCDVGIIPYDETLLYYNLAYPTKLSFYLTAGIPFLSTPVRETVAVQNKYGVGYVAFLSDWPDIINSFSLSQIKIEKEKIKDIKHDFYWENAISESLFLKQLV